MKNDLKNIWLLVFIILRVFGYSSIPEIKPQDIIFERANLGYDLYIKKLPGIKSILLTESQKDPGFKKTNYGLRTAKFHPCNGNEKRILNGKILYTKYDLFSLVDSTPEKHSVLNDAFHFFLPDKVYYGYEWTRKGELEIKDGVEINLRLFAKEYADYSDEFKDQWIILRLIEKNEIFLPKVIDDLREIAEVNQGVIILKDEDNDLEHIFLKQIPENVPTGKSADIVFIIDTTLSMKEEIPVFKQLFPEMEKNLHKIVNDIRIGFIFYRDYGEMFLTKIYDLTDDMTYINHLVKLINIDGGDDIPEAVFEAIYDLKNLTYRSGSRIAFLIADAPAHPYPRGKITKNMAFNIIKDYRIKIISICLPIK